MNDIKMEGEPAQFESGAVRYTKNGKGRFDLIPGEVIVDIMDYVNNMDGLYIAVNRSDLIKFAYETCANDMSNDINRYFETIINIVCMKYAPTKHTVDEETGYETVRVSPDEFIIGFCKMLKELSKHYENGAEKYGIDNWKKGIPVIGGPRGGSFTDSGLRHFNQWMCGETDEPHAIACIWNFIGAIWTLKYKQDDVVEHLLHDIVE
jgi:hypothetical protein